MLISIITRHCPCFARRAMVAAAAAVVVRSGARAGALEFEKRWEGNLGGDSRYFAPQAMTAGDFTREPGTEILVFDTDGYAYFLAWKDNALKAVWITSVRAIPGHIASLAAVDVDGDGQDEAAVLDREGVLHILGGEKKKFKVVCGDCIPAEFKGLKPDFVAPVQADSDRQEELLLLGEIKDKRTAVVIKQHGKVYTAMTSDQINVKGDIANLMPANNPAKRRFFLHLYQGRAGDSIQPFYLDEEGVQLEPEIDLDSTKVSVIWTFAGDTDSDRNNELFVIGSTGTGTNSHRSVGVFNPGSKVFSPMPKAKADATFVVAPDLNGDGIAELVFADYNGSVVVYSKAVPGFVVNGKPKTPGANMRIRDGEPYVTVVLLPGIAAKKSGNFLLLTGNKRKLGLDLKKSKSTLRLPGEEESVDGKVKFFTSGSAVFMEAESLADALDFTADWDALSQTLKLKF